MVEHLRHSLFHGLIKATSAVNPSRLYGMSECTILYGFIRSIRQQNRNSLALGQTSMNIQAAMKSMENNLYSTPACEASTHCMKHSRPRVIWRSVVVAEIHIGNREKWNGDHAGRSPVQLAAKRECIVDKVPSLNPRTPTWHLNEAGIGTAIAEKVLDLGSGGRWQRKRTAAAALIIKREISVDFSFFGATAAAGLVAVTSKFQNKGAINFMSDWGAEPSAIFSSFKTHIFTDLYYSSTLQISAESLKTTTVINNSIKAAAVRASNYSAIFLTFSLSSPHYSLQH